MPAAAAGDASCKPAVSEEVVGELIARVSRLEAALTLTAGTVHDVNNILTVLSGNLFLLTENVRDRSEAYEQARRARNAADRGSTLLRELLTFNRKAESEARSISPGSHVLALEPLLLRMVRSAGHERQLIVSVEQDAASVVAGAAHLESVVINLVINARDALERTGKVKLRVANVEVPAKRAEKLGIPPGSYVCIEVSDNGRGIPADILPRVTEPLFSTKPRDRGSGLGLAMAQHFAKSGGGTLIIDSLEGSGTRVRLLLPQSRTPAETTANMTLPLSSLPGGDERVLLLCRDAEVRSSLEQILSSLGYSVAAADSMETAGRLLSSASAPALVLCDRTAAGLRVERRWMAGLRERHADLRHLALLQAGSDPATVAPDADGYLFRPVAVQALARTVREVLGSN